jgi:hypothetical protein
VAKILLFFPFTYVAGVWGFVIFFPYLLLFTALYLIVDRSRRWPTARRVAALARPNLDRRSIDRPQTRL